MIGIVLFSSFAMLLVVTELPVDCPGFPETVNADPETNIYKLPSFGPDDVTLSSGIEFYFPHPFGTDFVVIISPSNHLIVGTNTITTVISDDELSKTCVSTITGTGQDRRGVRGWQGNCPPYGFGFFFFFFCLSAQSRPVMIILPLPHYGKNFAAQCSARQFAILPFNTGAGKFHGVVPY